MIDTITLSIDKMQYPKSKIWRYNIPQENIIQTSAETFKGNLQNLKIMESMQYITITGSMGKYLNGENITPKTRNDYTDALQKLENETGLELKNSFLRRVDFGENIPTNKPVFYYMDLLGTMRNSRYKRSTVDGCNGLESVLYQTRTGSIQFCAYDKILEFLDFGKINELPTEYTDTNLLRMEFRITNRQGIKKRLGHGADITPYKLAEKDTYKELQKQFFSFYSAIPKHGRQVFADGEKNITPKEFTELCAESFRQLNPQEYKLLLQTLKTKGRITDWKRIKDKERRNSQNYAFSDTNPLIIELDEKTHYRAFYGA